MITHIMILLVCKAGTIQIQIQIICRFEGFDDNYRYFYQLTKKSDTNLHLHLQIDLNYLIK